MPKLSQRQRKLKKKHRPMTDANETKTRGKKRPIPEDDWTQNINCWGCGSRLKGLDPNIPKGTVQGLCSICGARNPKQIPRKRTGFDFWANLATDKFMFCFTALVQPYCVLMMCRYILPHVLSKSGMDKSAGSQLFFYGTTLAVSFGTMFNYWAGVLKPVTQNTLPKNVQRFETVEINGRMTKRPTKETEDFTSIQHWSYCAACDAPKDLRTHHCSTCGVCVPNMDHHCPFFGGSCVGKHNHRNFLLFLLYMMLTVTWMLLVMICFWNYLPGFPKRMFTRDFNRKVLRQCTDHRGNRKSFTCSFEFLFSQPDIFLFGVVTIEVLLTGMTLFLVSILFFQQVGDLMQNLNRFEARVAHKKKLPVQMSDSCWGELDDVCGNGRSVCAWVCLCTNGPLAPASCPKISHVQ